MTDERYSNGRTQQDIDDFNRGWARFLVDILHEQIERVKVSDTHRLEQSIQYAMHGTETIEHKFLRYGIYVAAGVGRGFKHGNGGDLPFMGAAYREEHGYDKKQVGYEFSKGQMLEPKYERKVLVKGKHAGQTVALARGRRQREDWFLKKYYYQLQRLNEKNAEMYGDAYQGMMSTYLQALFRKISDPNMQIRSNRF